MKWKLDENIGSRTAGLFLQAGHDAETVLQEKLSGASDEALYAVCVREDRCLLTLDIDFADVLRFPPHRTAGIAVLRLPKNPSLRLLETLAGERGHRRENGAIAGERGHRRVSTDPSVTRSKGI